MVIIRLFTCMCVSCICMIHHSSSTRPAKVPKLNTAHRSCQVISREGFYVEHILGIINFVNSFADCLLACLNIPSCQSVNYLPPVFGSPLPGVVPVKCDRCFISGSNIKEYRTLHFVEKSIHAMFLCSDGTKAPRYVETVFHGAAPRDCGVSAFNIIEPVLSLSAPTFAKRVVGGSKAPPYSQPWLGQIILHWDNICGITLFSYDESESAGVYGLSAAHCFLNDDELLLPKHLFGFVFGVHDIRFPSAHAIYRPAEKIVIHPLFYGTGKQSDIAIVKFASKIRYNDYIRPICLPQLPAGAAGEDSPFETACTICGLGSEGVSAEDIEIFPNTPNCFKTKLLRPGIDIAPAINMNRLTYYLAESDPVRYKGIGDGDSGGPVSCLVRNKNAIFGIVSGARNSRFGVLGKVNVFTRVPYYLKWIKKVIDKEEEEEEAINNNEIDALPLTPISVSDNRFSFLSCFPSC